MTRRLTLALLGSGLVGAALVASIFSPQNAFLIVFVGLMMFMHLFGHGGHGGHSHGGSEGDEHHHGSD